MLLRFGKWIELGIHFGSPNRAGDVPDTHVIHAAIRFGLLNRLRRRVPRCLGFRALPKANLFS